MRASDEIAQLLLLPTGLCLTLWIRRAQLLGLSRSLLSITGLFYRALLVPQRSGVAQPTNEL